MSGLDGLGGRGGQLAGLDDRLELFGDRLLYKILALRNQHVHLAGFLAVTISAWTESLLRYIWQPSVLSTEMVGTDPSTCICTDWQLINSQLETTESKTTAVFLHESRMMLLHLPLIFKVLPSH